MPHNEASHALAAGITRAASKQAYYTIRFLVDHDRRRAAYQAYAYFRWVDDQLDRPTSEWSERLAFLARQEDIVTAALRGRVWNDLTCEEQLVADMLLADDQSASGLNSYVSNMMAVMAFDAQRRGRWVTEQELEQYTQHLAIAVTDAMQYFIGHNSRTPSGALAHSEARYFPAMAAHITHMLRDTLEDVALGYFNVPCELLESSGITPHDVQSAAFRDWVKGRVQLAHTYFKRGASYLDQLPNMRCRLAGYAYMARFVGLLDALEREEYRIRPAYPEFTHPGYAMRVGGSVLRNTLLRGTR
jgi:phytoene/squalene synthetase